METIAETRIDNTEQRIDSRNVLERIAFLEVDIPTRNPAYETEEDTEELASLKTLIQTLRDIGTGDSPEDGCFLIRESYFTEYAQELAEDIGAISDQAHWPMMHIDWEAAAESLKMDYVEIDFDGVTYLVR